MGWRWAFYIHLPIGAVSLVLGFARLQEARIPGKVQYVDLVGMLLLVVSDGGAALALTQYESPDWSHVMIRIIAVTTSLALIAFIGHVVRVWHPLVDLNLFRSRPIAWRTWRRCPPAWHLR